MTNSSLFGVIEWCLHSSSLENTVRDVSPVQYAAEGQNEGEE